MVRLFVGLFLLVVSARPALCVQVGGGFPPGDVLLYSPAVQGGSSADGAILRIDVETGQATMLVDLIQTLQFNGAVAYDPFRDRVLFCGGFTGPGLPTALYAVDAAGNTQSLGYAGSTLYAMAPASGGRVYLRNATGGSPVIQYLDAGNVLRTLLDASGVPYLPVAGAAFQCMTYDAGTNALFVAYVSQLSAPCGGSTKPASVWRLPLSADGSRVLGGETCVQVAPDPNGGNDPVGWSRAPGGKLLLVLDTGSSQTQPRMQLLDPVTMGMTPFAWSSGVESVATNAGTWSSKLGKAVVLDTFGDTLRAFAQGEVGPGTAIVTSVPVSSSGGSHERATLIEVAPGECSALVGLYCTAKTTSAGCLPALSSAGSPSASAGAGFTVRVDAVEAGNLGLFFYGHHGPAAQPFQGGTMCVQAPIWRTPAQVSSGAGACAGSYQLDFNAYVLLASDPLLQAGATLHGQFWFRDPPEPISGTGLSSGIAFTLCP